MNKLATILAAGAMGGLLLTAAGCNQLKARDQLNRGVAAFKAAQFNEAIEDFQTAIKLDPTLTNAKLYLATAYQSQFIPGAPSADNMKMAQMALDEYKVVLDTDSGNQQAVANATAGIARLNYDMGNLDDARTYYLKSVELQPTDPTAYYTLGAIAYQKTNRGISLMRQTHGLTKPDDPLITKKSTKADRQSCDSMAQEDNPIIDDGIAQLKKALTLRPGYADAMTYLNLLYRAKADLTCGDDATRKANLDIANNYVTEALAARKAEVAKQNKEESGGVVLDTKQPKGNEQ